MQGIPPHSFPGFKFDPSEEELISHYLHRKVHGGLTPEEADLIKEYNLYEGAHPSCDIFKKFTGHKGGGDALYFFTTLIKKTPNSTRFNRTDGNGGTWSGEEKDPVKCTRGYVIGTKRRFSYENKKRPDQDGCWTLLEYSTPEYISENVVVCKLKESISRKRKRMDPVEKPAHHQEPRPLIQNQEMLPLVGTVSNEDNGGFSSIHNIGPMTAAGDNAVTPENAAPAVSAIPAPEDYILETCSLEDLQAMLNDPNWLENHQGLMGTNFSMEY